MMLEVKGFSNDPGNTPAVSAFIYSSVWKGLRVSVIGGDKGVCMDFSTIH